MNLAALLGVASCVLACPPNAPGTVVVVGGALKRIQFNSPPWNDFFTIEFSQDGGATWTTLSRTTGASPAYPSWRAALLELPTGSTRCRIRFGIESDEKANDYPGVGLDQVEVRADP
jgi:hypothetical protein